MLPPDYELDESVATEERTKVRKPPLYKVLLHNDDYTTMDFVVQILESIFHRSTPEAIQVMLSVHRRGVGIAGVFTYEIAEMKVAQVTALAQAHEFPLLCTLEEE
ncbi:MAG: ATP-dependent Clp protease adaptor ClpS [Thermoanaerobaculia bacterium]